MNKFIILINKEDYLTTDPILMEGFGFSCNIFDSSIIYFYSLKSAIQFIYKFEEEIKSSLRKTEKYKNCDIELCPAEICLKYDINNTVKL